MEPKKLAVVIPDLAWLPWLTFDDQAYRSNCLSGAPNS